MNQTEYYQLSLWDAEDRIQRTDFNADNAKLEEALTDHAAALAGCGNCKIESFTYTGTWSASGGSPLYLNFSKPPLLFIVRGSEALMVGSKLFSGATAVFFYSSVGANIRDLDLTWVGNQAQLTHSTAGYYLNASGKTYWVFALCAEDES